VTTATRQAEARLSRVEQPVVGFRAFLEHDGWLESLTPDHVDASGRMVHSRWLPDAVIDARCNPQPGVVPHVAPAIGCRCGVNACDSLATLQRAIGSLDRRGLVIGAVQMWSSSDRKAAIDVLHGRPSGLVIRSPYARLIAIASGRSSDRVRDRYHVEVVPLASLEPVARERGGMQLQPPPVAGRRPDLRPLLERAVQDQSPAVRLIVQGIVYLGELSWTFGRSTVYPIVQRIGRWTLAWLRCWGPRIAIFCFAAAMVGRWVAPEFSLAGRIEVGTVVIGLPLLALAALGALGRRSR
jgi:hypothetical protein